MTKSSEKQKKIACFFRQGGNVFLDKIVNILSDHFDIRSIVIKTDADLKLIDHWMEWGDICWFEWCDSILVYASHLPAAKTKKIICRLHSYEAFTNYPRNVDWGNVDKLIFVADHIRRYVISKFDICIEKTAVVPNGVNLEDWTFKQRGPGYKVAYVGYINYKKGPMLLLQTLKALYNQDHRYKLFVAGKFQDPRDLLYFQQMIKELQLDENYYFEDWQKDLDKWLEDKDYVLCTSVLESQNMSIMQAMAAGIKPIIHNFYGAKNVYPQEYIWNTVDEAVQMITDNKYDSASYRKYVEENYSMEKQITQLMMIIKELINSASVSSFNYKNYWTQRLNAKFDIEGVGYLGLGEAYNKLLYTSRLELLEQVLNLVFDKLENKRILELGPGTGVFTDYFHKQNVIEFNAIDIVEKSVQQLSQRFITYHFKQGDIAQASSYGGKYDLVFAAAVLLHLTDEQAYTNVVENISNHLEDNGYLILMDPISLIKTKSQSSHVVIRDIEYVKEILRLNQLELVGMLPVSFFMNYPFDKDLLGTNGETALKVFTKCCTLFKKTGLSEQENNLLGRYLLIRDKMMRHQYNFGLSEKMLIIQKQGTKHAASFEFRDLYSMQDIEEENITVNEQVAGLGLHSHPEFKRLVNLLFRLEK